MRQRRRREVPEDLARAAEELARWRQQREPGERIPARFWDTAVELAQRYGASRTATALRMGYYDLKRRLPHDATVRPKSRVPLTQPQFAELPLSPYLAANECVVEFEDGLGARLKIQWRGTAVPDLVALGRDFWKVV